jgi:PAS domain S-box-containing protein
MATQDPRWRPESRSTSARLFRTALTVSSFRLLGVLTLLLLTSQSATAAEMKSRQVLLLYTEEKDLPMNLIIDSQLRLRFREQLGDGVALFSEYLDVNRFSDRRMDRKHLEFLRDKYSAHKLDLIVVIDHPALDLIQLHRDWFFPATPVVFCCVTEAEYKARTIGPGITGIPAKLEYKPTLELALRLHPRTRRVVVITGATKFDAETMADVRRELRPFEDTVEFRYLGGLHMADLRQEVSQFSGDTIIIYLSVTQDGAGTFFFPREALVQISQVARVPVYGYYDSYLGHGIVGGFVGSFEIEANNAARLGLRILAGSKPKDPSTTGTPSCAYMFDWGQLKRWGIDEGALPLGSIVRFRAPSFWDVYRWQIIVILSLCALQAMLIVGLLLQRTRRRRAEKEIRQAEERFRMVVESAPSAAVVVNTDGKIVLVNAQCERLFSYRRNDLVGQPAEQLVPERFRTKCPSHGVSFFTSPSAPAMGRGRELFCQRKDRSEFPVEIRLTPMQSGEGSLILCVIVDITARRQAEEARQELAHASRLALVGELTASIAHEINQPLGAIISYADAAELLLESGPEWIAQVRKILEYIRRDDLRASEVIRRLRTLLRKDEMEMRPVDVNDLASDVLLLIRPESRRRHVTIETQFAANLPLVRGDKVHLQQVVLNLFLNGMEAMADMHGEKRLTVRTVLNQSGWVEIAIGDVGTGIPPDRLPRLFEPFFSTKKTGMGLGLSLARSLIEAHGGRIWAENNAPAGATFRFALPIDGKPSDRGASAVEQGAVETSV